DADLRAIKPFGLVEPFGQPRFDRRIEDAREIAHVLIGPERLVAPRRRAARGEQGGGKQDEEPDHRGFRCPPQLAAAAASVPAGALSFEAAGAAGLSERMSSVGATSAPSVAAS